ncbi:MAG: DUF4912 domain-containing protein [Pegethrix bostrychoides GSE-TBD4-15B]|uniref:DUF4912 domain-containing protein n=1 Tax=Pegethrix bostrychoides GSE-TBD4-15B TaxID=2839662 RepID=A0A951P7Z5_9CYAN|nr:DUF4912 domain-containing protein [Pegethrix bostrychoides GSE-TBD4-15B]
MSEPSLEEMTLRQLRRVASELAVSRYSRMRKDQLLEAIKAAQRLRLAANPPRVSENPPNVAAVKFDAGTSSDPVGQPAAMLTVVDTDLSELPSGYGESRIVLMPRDPQWAYAYWDIPNEHKEYLRRQGGNRLALRFYDVTDMSDQRSHSLQQYECDELAREWYLPVPVSDREYAIEIGYIAMDGRWLLLARSATVRIPPVYPSDWVDDQFVTIDWEQELRGETVLQLKQPVRQPISLSVSQFASEVAAPVYAGAFAKAQAAEAQRVAGSVSTSKAQQPEQSISSYVFPSGMGKWAGKTESGVGMSGVGMSGAGLARTESGVGISGVGMSGMGMSGMGMYSSSGIGMSGMGLAARTESGTGMSGVGMSGMGMSGMGMYSSSGIGMSGMGLAARTESGAGLLSRTESGAGMSGVGMSGMGMYSSSGMGMSGAGMYSSSGTGLSASMPPIRPRQFWLVADAELIVYGATEPDASVTIAGRPIQLNSDGTFRFQMSFQDGLIDFPIMAVAADGEQIRSLHLKFERETPARHTNTKAEAIPEWIS